MKKFALEAQPRVELGKKSRKNLRKEGLIPAVINGGAIVNFPITALSKPDRSSWRSMTSAASSPPTSQSGVRMYASSSTLPTSSR